MSNSPISPPPYQPPPYGSGGAMPSNATTALVISIVALIACQLASPVGWYLSQKELDQIDAGINDPTKRDQANAGKIVGIIGTVLVGLGLLVFVGFIVLAVGIGTTAN